MSKLERNEGVNPAVIRMKNILEWQARKHEVPETGESWMCLRNSEVSETRREEGRG